MGNHGGGRAGGPVAGARPPHPGTGTHQAAPGSGSHQAVTATGAHHAVRTRRRGLPLLVAVLAGLLLLAVGVVAGRMTLPGSTAAGSTAAGSTAVGTTAAGSGAGGPATPAASASPVSANPAASHPTMLGEVVRVDSGDEVVVRVDGTEQTVAVLGITAPRLAGPERTTAECGAKEALTFADDRLSGQTVTLVPDPTVPETDDRGRRLAYVVLPSQLNYTDAALQAGVVVADTSRPLWYAPVFAREQSDAVAANRGLWGPPCDATPGRALPLGR
jgi:micrococcal nuclease